MFQGSFGNDFTNESNSSIAIEKPLLIFVILQDCFQKAADGDATAFQSLKRISAGVCV